MVTMASEKDFRHPEIGKVVEKYFRGVASVPTEHRMRILRLIENITLGTAAVGYRTESMHGAGSPQAQRIMISRQGNLEQKKMLAKELAGINAEGMPYAQDDREGHRDGNPAAAPSPRR
jgi:4-hydroxybutyryl-CoA dehydratase/vinylacetyl-CoA-Delta-isomerase